LTLKRNVLSDSNLKIILLKAKKE